MASENPQWVRICADKPNTIAINRGAEWILGSTVTEKLDGKNLALVGRSLWTLRRQTSVLSAHEPQLTETFHQWAVHLQKCPVCPKTCSRPQLPQLLQQASAAVNHYTTALK
jgi:hypothetical protein